MTGLLAAAPGGTPLPTVLAATDPKSERPTEVVIRLLSALALTYALGFERELRGSPAGDRTFSLIGVGTAVIGILAEHGGPNALVGAVTGVGFIGGGLVFRQSTKEGDVLHTAKATTTSKHPPGSSESD